MYIHAVRLSSAVGRLVRVATAGQAQAFADACVGWVALSCWCAGAGFWNWMDFIEDDDDDDDDKNFDNPLSPNNSADVS